MRNSIQFSTAEKVAKDSKTLNDKTAICQAYVREMEMRLSENISISSYTRKGGAANIALRILLLGHLVLVLCRVVRSRRRAPAHSSPTAFLPPDATHVMPFSCSSAKRR